MTSFQDKLDQSIDRTDSLLCVGLDPDHTKLPTNVGQFVFNRAVIDATGDLVCAYKPNPAFYEALGAPGVEALKRTCDYIHKTHPGTPIIIDAKRADIGNTNRGYAEYIFGYLGADAVTVPPYMGLESLAIFLEYKDQGVFVLCRTSNPGAGEFQDLRPNGEPLYRHVARQVSREWNAHRNCMLVVAATRPQELREVRELVGPTMPLLIPGIGIQGGDIAAAMRAGLGAQDRGLIISASRSIIFAGSGPGYADEAREAATKLKHTINQHRSTI